jgi:DNA-directed RNA polymerase subunit F
MTNVNFKYQKKYIKYKNKYLKLKGGDSVNKLVEQLEKTNESYDTYIQKITDIIKNSTISVNLVTAVQNYIEKSDSNELTHILEDLLMKKFISDIVEEKISDKSEINKIGSIIKKINDADYTRWYA